MYAKTTTRRWVPAGVGWVVFKGGARRVSLAEIRQINRGAMNQNKYKATAKSEALRPTLYERFRYTVAPKSIVLGVGPRWALSSRIGLPKNTLSNPGNPDCSLFCQIRIPFFSGPFAAVGWQCRAVR